MQYLGTFADKDVLFSVFFLGFVSSFAKVVYFRVMKKVDVVLLILFTILSCITLKGYEVIFFPAVLVLLFILPKKNESHTHTHTHTRKTRGIPSKIVSVFLVLVLSAGFISVWNFSVDKLLRPEKDTNIYESMSMPLQMMAFTLNQKDANVTTEERQYFENLISPSKLSDYTTYISDPIKSNVRTKSPSPSISNFLKNWLSVCSKNPDKCAKGYFLQIENFLYPTNIKSSYLRYKPPVPPPSYKLLCKSNSLEKCNKEIAQKSSLIRVSVQDAQRIMKPILGYKNTNPGFSVLENYRETIQPIALLFSQPSLYFWLTFLVCLLIFVTRFFDRIRRKKVEMKTETENMSNSFESVNSRLILVFIPIVLLWIRLFLFAPIAYLRYVMPVIIVMPFLLVLLISKCIVPFFRNRTFVKNKDI
jgi:hypothetical protein